MRWFLAARGRQHLRERLDNVSRHRVTRADVGCGEIPRVGHGTSTADAAAANGFTPRAWNVPTNPANMLPVPLAARAPLAPCPRATERTMCAATVQQPRQRT